MKRYFWTGIFNEDRTSGISCIEECINKYGFIIDYKFFSDISMSMVIEIKERHIKTLYEDLMKIILFTNPIELTADSENECVILFNITFAKGTGDMIIEVPSVPG